MTADIVNGPGAAAPAPPADLIGTVVILGFPNVGKSTLINRLTSTRAAVVHETAARRAIARSSSANGRGSSSCSSTPEALTSRAVMRSPARSPTRRGWLLPMPTSYSSSSTRAQA